MTTTATPRTDAEAYVWQNVGENPFVHRDFARQLERELAVSLENQVKTQAKVERIKSQLKRSIEITEESWELEGYADKDLKAELDQIKEKIK